jgi:hypothetical protein
VGTVSVNFDLSAFTIGNSADLVLLIDTDDGSFVNSTIVSLSSFAANIATFNSVNFSSGNWFTVASLSRSNPLPIELLEFDALLDGDQVQLNWKTLAEINNDYFTIERTSNFEKWQAVATVDGAGNANKLLSYSTIDKNPLPGISYYRLKQTDFDGQFSYSDLEVVSFKNEMVTKLRFYPNPVSNELTIEGEREELERFKVYNTKGQEVSSKVNRKVWEDDRLILDVSKLLKGSYFLRTINKSSIFIKQ